MFFPLNMEKMINFRLQKYEKLLPFYATAVYTHANFRLWASRYKR